MNRKVLAVGLIAILAVSVSVALIIYFQKHSQEAGAYTIIGILSYAPGRAVFPGISATSVKPSVSPEPSNITYFDPYGVNNTVASFVGLNFPSKNPFAPNGFGDYPVGFTAGDLVKVYGKMSYSTVYQWYIMNVTSITHYSS